MKILLILICIQLLWFTQNMDISKSLWGVMLELPTNKLVHQVHTQISCIVSSICDITLPDNRRFYKKNGLAYKVPIWYGCKMLWDNSILVVHPSLVSAIEVITFFSADTYKFSTTLGYTVYVCAFRDFNVHIF